MPKLNRVLISSIVSQAEELISLSKEISQSIEEKIDSSVKLPITATINAETIEMLKDYKGTAGEMYILLLELAYDRINVVVRLMIEFVDQQNGLQSPEKTGDETLTSLVRVEDHATVATCAKLLWRRLKTLPEAGKIDSRDIERMTLFDEYKIAIGHRLAVMTESNIALEKTVVEIRKEIIDRLAKDKVAESQPRYLVNDDEIIMTDDVAPKVANFNEPSRTSISTQTNEPEETSDEVTMGTNRAQCASSLLLLTPDDDPVTDMSREILSNEKKIDDLLRQNERLSRALLRISQYNKNNNNAEKKSRD